MRVRPFRAIKTAFRILYTKAVIFIPFHFWCFISHFKKHKKQSEEIDWESIREIAEKITFPPSEEVVVESSLSEVVV